MKNLRRKFYKLTSLFKILADTLSVSVVSAKVVSENNKVRASTACDLFIVFLQFKYSEIALQPKLQPKKINGNLPGGNGKDKEIEKIFTGRKIECGGGEAQKLLGFITSTGENILISD